MKCKKCGRQFEGSFCPDCGMPADGIRTCPECGRNTDYGDRFCPACGHDFESNAKALKGTDGDGGKQTLPSTPPQKPERPVASATAFPFSEDVSFATILSTAVALAMLPFIVAIFFINSGITTTDTIMLVSFVAISLAAATAIPVVLHKKFSYGTWAYSRFRKVKENAPEATVNGVAIPKAGFMAATAIALCILLAVVCFLLYSATFNLVVPIAFGVLMAAFAIGVLIMYIKTWRKDNMLKQVCMAYYGNEKFKNKDKCVLTNAQVAGELKNYEDAWDNYLLYPSRQKAYEREAVFTAGNAKRTLLLRKILPAVASILLPAAISVALTAACVPYVNNPFRADKIAMLSVGMRVSESDSLSTGIRKYTADTLFAMIGEPYETEGDGAVRTLKYYSDNYRRLLEESAKYAADGVQDFDDLEAALELEQKLAAEKFAYIEIETGQKKNAGGNDEIVTSIYFDPEHMRDDYETGSALYVNVTFAEIEQYAATGTIIAEVKYSDGSIWKGYAAARVDDGDTQTTGGTVSLVWTDPYAFEEHRTTATVTEAEQDN